MPENTDDYKNALSLLQLIPNLFPETSIANSFLKEDGNVIFVRKGSKIVNDFDVLWPDPNVGREKIKDALQKMSSVITLNSEDQDRLDELARRFSNLIIERNRNRGENNSNITIPAGEISNISRQMEEIVNEVLDIRRSNGGILSQKSELKDIISVIENTISIVFHKLHDNNSCLFLGDITNTEYDQFIADEIYKNSYKYIKVAHHGTERYFSSFLPTKSEILIISNGKGTRNMSDGWRISKNYPCYYKDKLLICTHSDNCELIQDYHDKHYIEEMFCSPCLKYVSRCSLCYCGRSYECFSCKILKLLKKLFFKENNDIKIELV